MKPEAAWIKAFEEHGIGLKESRKLKGLRHLKNTASEHLARQASMLCFDFIGHQTDWLNIRYIRVIFIFT